MIKERYKFPEVNLTEAEFDVFLNRGCYLVIGEHLEIGTDVYVPFTFWRERKQRWEFNGLDYKVVQAVRIDEEKSAMLLAWD